MMRALLLAAAVPWFALDPTLGTGWTVKGDPSTAAQIEIVPTRPGPAQKRIFVLTSKASPSYTVGLNRIMRVLRQEGVQASFTDLNYNKRDDLGNQALATIRSGHYDLVLAIGSEATDFLYRRYKGGPVPVVSAEAKDPVLLGQVKAYDQGSGTNFAFTSLNVPVKLQMAYLQRLRQGLANVAVLYSARNQSSVETQVNPLVAIGPAAGVDVLRVGATHEDLVGDFRRLMPEAIARMKRRDPELKRSVFWIVGATEVFSQIHAINQLAGGVPVLSAVPDVVAPGEDSAALAIGVNFGDNAHVAGLYAARILKGTAKAGELPVGVVQPPDIAISFLKARQCHLQVPFDLFETASRVVDAGGRLVREDNRPVSQPASR
jgi:putative ABC transport system substrate-binding protein